MSTFISPAGKLFTIAPLVTHRLRLPLPCLRLVVPVLCSLAGKLSNQDPSTIQFSKYWAMSLRDR